MVCAYGTQKETGGLHIFASDGYMKYPIGGLL